MRENPSFLEHGSPMLVRHHAGRLKPHAAIVHTEHVLAFIETGALRMDHGGEVEATGGTLAVMPAGVPHHALGGEAEWWMVGFCASCLGLDEGQRLMEPFHAVRAGAVPILPVARGRHARVKRLFRDLAEECERDVPEAPELARSLLHLLLGELCRARPRDADDFAATGLVGDALRFVQRHALDGISLRDVAKAVHRTPSHVASAVKETTGHTVGDWIRAARIAEAATWLAHTDESLDAIAERVGWRDKTHFIRQFRKVHGVTPAAWRRERR